MPEFGSNVKTAWGELDREGAASFDVLASPWDGERRAMGRGEPLVILRSRATKDLMASDEILRFAQDDSGGRSGMGARNNEV